MENNLIQTQEEKEKTENFAQKLGRALCFMGIIAGIIICVFTKRLDYSYLTGEVEYVANWEFALTVVASSMLTGALFTVLGNIQECLEKIHKTINVDKREY